MIVVIEGVDGAGKTRLARHISTHCSIEYADRLKLGFGPPKSPQDIIDRFERYLKLDGVIFDRHPAISQPIYGTLRDDPPLPQYLFDKFYSSKPVIIYARCIDAKLASHVADSPADTPEHLSSVEENYDKLLRMYDEWALGHAHIWYRDYADMKLVTAMVQGAFRR